jgi:hypothetical protein
MIRTIQTAGRVLALLATCAMGTRATGAQTAGTQPAAGAAQSSGAFNYKADKISITNSGVRLDGNAQITSPQLEVRGAAIGFDVIGTQSTRVRARNNV